MPRQFHRSHLTTIYIDGDNVLIGTKTKKQKYSPKCEAAPTASSTTASRAFQRTHITILCCAANYYYHENHATFWGAGGSKRSDQYLVTTARV